MKKSLNQIGVVHVLPLLLIIAAVGVISFLLISSTLPTGGLFGLLNPKPSSHAAAINIGDWPQLGHDPQKSNASKEGVNGPYRFYWRWTKVPLAGRVQPVIVNNVLYIGGLDGNFYALNAAGDNQGGQPTTIWQKTLNTYDPNLNLGNIATADPIRAGAGVDTSNNTIVVGTQHGTIYGLDTATGNTKWTVFTGGAILAAPLMDESGTAYLGSSDGYFYSINTNTGAVNWKTLVKDQNNRPAPILGSAALSNDGTAVFFVGENVKAYSLNITNGSTNWSVQLQGQSGSNRWPVVLNNEVVFITQQLNNEWDLLNEGDCILYGGTAATCPGNRISVTPIAPSLWQADWEASRSAITNFLTNNPDRQTYFALDTATGQTKGIPPILFSYGFGGPMPAPVIYNNNFYVRYRPRHGIQNDGGNGGVQSIHVSSKYDDEYGLMDPNTLDITDLTTTDPYSVQFRSTSDEAAIPTIAGNMLIVDTWERLGGIQLNASASGNLVGIAQNLNHNVATNPPCNDTGGGMVLMPFYETCPQNNPPAVDENGWDRVGAVEGAGRIFWRPRDGGLGAIGPANNITNPPAPLASAIPITSVGPYPTPIASPSAQQLQNYVWNSPSLVATSSAAPDLVQKLNQEVSAIVNTNQHLLPYYIERGMYGQGSYPPDTNNSPEPANVEAGKAYWFDPGEFIYSLAIAYPYLNTTLQGQVKTYLQQEMTRYSPITGLPFGGNWTTSGISRESYPISSSFRSVHANEWPPTTPALQTLYALWVYANNTGDWNYISTNWVAIQNLFQSKTNPISSLTVSNNSIDSFGEIAGAIGYARMAKHLSTATGDSFDQAATVGQNAAVAAMQTGLAFVNWLNIANNLYAKTNQDPTATELPGMRGGVFFGLVPEVGQYLHDTNKSAVDYVLNYSTGYNSYNTKVGNPTSPAGGCFLWYVTREGMQCSDGETNFESPELSWSTFLTQAYIEQLNQQQLRYFLDRPWGLGDPWFLQKLVATIQAPTNSVTSTPTPTPTPSPSTSPSPCQGADLNHNGVVDLLDYSILVSHFNHTVTPGTLGDINNNGVVDLLDYSILVSNFGKTGC